MSKRNKKHRVSNIKYHSGQAERPEFEGNTRVLVGIIAPKHLGSLIHLPLKFPRRLKHNIKLLKRAPKRGRPEEAEVTVIGLPKRKKGNRSLKLYKDFYFAVERERMILHWIVADADPNELQDLSKIPSSESDLSMQILDQDVDISEGRQHFSVEAWAKVLDLVERKEKSHERVCSV
ncbi:hypothetical protein PoB_005281400 [Plakobranchus ocellatus]|uniref:Uncharacterized protein n=1 Tax=Plakobranchus ocellatus TaxID=259542 RepID=A0AAV4C6K6_9GAST|nr:hypothetical protein PoB_005281400 [Plakobranchus ocellatus]